LSWHFDWYFEKLFLSCNVVFLWVLVFICLFTNMDDKDNLKDFFQAASVFIKIWLNKLLKSYPPASKARRYKFHPICSLPPICKKKKKKKKKLNFPYGWGSAQKCLLSVVCCLSVCLSVMSSSPIIFWTVGLIGLKFFLQKLEKMRIWEF
jgi:hypothetical protein